MITSTTLPTNISDRSLRVFTPEFITTRIYDSVEKYLPTSQFQQLWIKKKQGKWNAGFVCGRIRKNVKTQRCLLWISILFLSNESKDSFICNRIYPNIKSFINYFRIFELLAYKKLKQYNNKEFLYAGTLWTKLYKTMYSISPK